MRRQPLILVLLLLTISLWLLWARLSATQSVAAHEPLAIAQDSPPATPPASPTLSTTPTLSPTPPSAMPTLAVTRQVEDEWQTYTSLEWGITFRYPSGWAVREESTTYRYPIFLNSPEENEGSISVFLAEETLSPGGSLAEWIALYNEYHGMDSMMGILKLQLSTLPADALPDGVTQGILTTGDQPINPARVVWVEHNGLVYSFASAYNRDEDLARIFAIVSTLEFDSDVEEELKASGAFNGDENTLREKFAQIYANVEPYCDFDCEYINRMQELARWKTLPASERPLVQPIRFGTPEGSWLTYTQPLLGISFRYEPNMAIIDPFAESDLDEESLFDHAIAIRWKNRGAMEEVMRIELFPYLASDDVPLNNWEAIQDQLNRANNPLHQFEYRLHVPIEWNLIAGEADDIVHTQDQAPYYRVETFWIRKDNVVFRITSDYPPLAGWVPTIISTLEFDTERLAELRDSGIFRGDERTMVAELQEAWVNPLPTIDPAATPTPIPTRTPYPTSTPTPIVRLIVTPSAFDSPLVKGMRRYQGESTYTGSPPFEIWFDPDVWQWSTSEQGGDFLVHQSIPGCEIDLQAWVAHSFPLEKLTLAGVEWSVSYLSAEYLFYMRRWPNISYFVAVTLPTPLPKMYDPVNKSQCQLDAETVIATHKVLAPDEASMMPTPTATPTRIPTSTITPVPTPTLPG